MRRPGSRPSTASIPGGRPGRGRLARREFEYVRNGTVSIVAALHVATGQVITEPIARNDSVTFTGFLHRLDQCIDPGLSIHLVMDNGSIAHLPGHACLDRRASPDHGHLHAEARVLAGHGRTMVLSPDPRPAAPRRVHLPRRPRRQDHQLHDPLQPDRQALDLDL